MRISFQLEADTKNIQHCDVQSHNNRFRRLTSLLSFVAKSHFYSSAPQKSEMKFVAAFLVLLAVSSSACK